MDQHEKPNPEEFKIEATQNPALTANEIPLELRRAYEITGDVVSARVLMVMAKQQLQTRKSKRVGFYGRIQYLAEWSNLPEETVKSALKKMRDAGLISYVIPPRDDETFVSVTVKKHVRESLLCNHVQKQGDL